MSSRLVIERVASEEVLRSGATAEDLALVEGFSSASRRCEAMAWRAIVRRVLGSEVKIGYDEYGAPVVDSPNINIGVSHSRAFVAVIFAQGACAVDIEDASRNFRRVATHFLCERELQMAEQYDIYAEMWCAKEALYKYHRRGGVEYRRDILLMEYRASEQTFLATIFGEEVEVSVSHHEDMVVATIG